MFNYQYGFLFLWLLLISSCDSNATGPSQKTTESPTALQQGREDAGNIHAIVSYHGQSSDLPTTAVVYVFARVPGTKMPLAVERFAPAELPMEVAFAHPKDSVDTVEIVARLSMTGVVHKLPEDEQVVSVPMTFNSSTQALKLEIPATGALEPLVSNPSVFIEVHVSLVDGLSLPDSTPIFISAREPSGFPVAVQKHYVADLPKTIRLSDADSMFSVNTLSQHEQVTLVARASLSGKPVASAGDWETVTAPITVSSLKKPIELTIDSKIE